MRKKARSEERRGREQDKRNGRGRKLGKRKREGNMKTKDKKQEEDRKTARNGGGREKKR